MNNRIVFLLFAISFFLLQSLSAQRTIELGFDASTLITGFFNEDKIISDYPLIVKFRNEKKSRAMRFGIGATFDRAYLDDPTNNVATTNTYQNYRFRVGFEKNKELIKKLDVIYGLDLVGSFQLNQSILDSSAPLSKLTNTFYGVGGGPIFGLHYKINKNFSLSTEMTLYFVAGLERQVLTNGDDDNVTRNGLFYSLETAPPTALYIIYRI